MSAEIVVILSNFPDADTARKAVRILVEEQLVACGNLIPGVESIYEWKGKIENRFEVTVLCKTTGLRAAEAQARLRALHPYDVPEILQIPITDGWPGYFSWVEARCRQSG